MSHRIRTGTNHTEGQVAQRSAAILVDVGYVWKRVAKAVGRQHRSDVALIGYGVPLVEALVEEAEGDGMEVLRTYWYDAAPDRNPNVQQRAVGRSPRIKLRLGLMTFGKQKGVDRMIQKDILALASNRAVTDIIILTGDQDMEEEIDTAGQHGMLVHVWGISDQNQEDDISGRLLRVADEWKVFPPDWAETFVQQDEKSGVGVPLASDAALDALRQRLHPERTLRAEPANDWTQEQFTAAGAEAYNSLKEQHGTDWCAIRDELKQSSWRIPNGEVRRSIPGKYDTELMDVVEAIRGQPLIENWWRISIRDGFWEQFDKDS